ncbi:potassium-transporting ATPase subunit C [Paraburkholderia guartelaensis]|uniref:Potassium-transporting ATPase KdpC subunit n=2 Tax=Paraburkholderia guartelaensis TaxID=2546446 RepID=A0A4R5LK91_9BURK|nr:potassium-transporting ATPase subunit C [Paraburkholderia guartelaensis]TDG10052.1 potassium-transporting ATPase subunit C [Paraburkholderia guartelaensis]
MLRHISKSLWLLGFAVVLVCGIYPGVLWVIGQTAFPFQANGSVVKGPDGKAVGSLLIAQPFTKDEYFQPRPSAVSYDASSSGSSGLGAANYALRDRVARVIGPIATYAAGPKAGQLVAPDVEAWFQADRFGGQPHIVAQWANAHNSLAQAWVNADPTHGAYVDAWAKQHPADVKQWIAANPGTPQPKAADLAVLFFTAFSAANPGKFPSAVTHKDANGKDVSAIEPVNAGSDVQSIFFDMWRQDHPDVALQNVPGDLVTASASGLDPDITLANAMFQLDRVAAAWAKDTKRDPAMVRAEIAAMLHDTSHAPLAGLVGEPMVNVLQMNLHLRRRYGAPA